jgi:predicted O-linked N-acetylglucosamine transferase (SPINDLY family)
VAGSLLKAIGLPELITNHLEEYRQLALLLAQDHRRLKGLQARLVVNRQSSRLFDSMRFARTIERAYQRMWTIQASGRGPQAFAVEWAGA